MLHGSTNDIGLRMFPGPVPKKDKIAQPHQNICVRSKAQPRKVHGMPRDVCQLVIGHKCQHVSHLEKRQVCDLLRELCCGIPAQTVFKKGTRSHHGCRHRQPMSQGKNGTPHARMTVRARSSCALAHAPGHGSCTRKAVSDTFAWRHNLRRHGISR